VARAWIFAARGRSGPRGVSVAAVARTTTRAQRRPLALLLGGLVIVAGVWLAGGLAAAAGWSLAWRWFAAGLVWPLVPLALLIFINPRLGLRRVAVALTLLGTGACALWWRAGLVEAATTHAMWMLSATARESAAPAPGPGREPSRPSLPVAPDRAVVPGKPLELPSESPGGGQRVADGPSPQAAGVAPVVAAGGGARGARWKGRAALREPLLPRRHQERTLRFRLRHDPRRPRRRRDPRRRGDRARRVAGDPGLEGRPRGPLRRRQQHRLRRRRAAARDPRRQWRRQARRRHLRLQRGDGHAVARRGRRQPAPRRVAEDLPQPDRDRGRRPRPRWFLRPGRQPLLPCRGDARRQRRQAAHGAVAAAGEGARGARPSPDPRGHPRHRPHRRWPPRSRDPQGRRDLDRGVDRTRARRVSALGRGRVVLRPRAHAGRRRHRGRLGGHRRPLRRGPLRAVRGRRQGRPREPRADRSGERLRRGRARRPHGRWPPRPDPARRRPTAAARPTRARPPAPRAARSAAACAACRARGSSSPMPARPWRSPPTAPSPSPCPCSTARTTASRSRPSPPGRSSSAR
jgi:hypothetical protein